MSRARTLIARYWGAVPIALVAILLALRALLVTAPRDQLAAAAAEPHDPPGAQAHTGYLWIARGGPVIVGYQSRAPARLVVGDKELQIGTGLVKDRIVLPAGAIAIRFAAPPGARLVWSPVGRRGDPEYVPASSLSTTTTFDAWAGAAPLDGAIALAILLVAIGACCMLARARLRAVDRRTWLALATVFALGCIVRWLGLGDFGQAWDEDVNWAAGRNYITNLLSLDFSASSWGWNYEHPPVMKYLAGIGAQLADGFGPARALSAVWTALGCALLVPIGARLYSFRVGVLAAVIATLLPPLVAHGQIIGHESPTVLWWTLGILLALGVHDGEPTRRQRAIRLAAVGFVIGIAVSSRFVNGLLGALCLGIVIEQAPTRLRAARDALLVMPVAALATFYALWPRLWLHPIGALRAAFDKLKQSHSVEPFLGTVTNQPGPHYFLVYLAATLPALVLAGALAWIARSVRMKARSTILVIGWFVIPLAVVASPVRQDGVRYVLPCVLALALMAAAGYDWLATLVGRTSSGRAFTAITALLALYLAITLARIHPYYLDYFGEQVGGPGTVAARGWFETAWWGEGVDRAVAYVNAHAAPNAKVFRNCIEPAHLAWFRAALWTPMVNDAHSADWIVTYSPQSHRCPIPPTAHRVFQVDAAGAVLAEVWQTR